MKKTATCSGKEVEKSYILQQDLSNSRKRLERAEKKKVRENKNQKEGIWQRPLGNLHFPEITTRLGQWLLMTLTSFDDDDEWSQSNR